MTDQTAGHTCGSLSLPTYSGEVVRCVLATGHERQCQSATEYPYVSWPNPSNIEQPDAEDGEQCGKWGGCILNPGHTGLHRHTPRPAERPQDHTDTNLRQLVAAAIHQYDNEHALSGNDIPSAHHYGEADAVLAVLDAEGIRNAANDTASDTAQHPADLRGQYARAIRDAVRVRLGTNALRLASEGRPVMLNYSEAEAAADAVLAIRDAARQASGQQPDAECAMPGFMGCECNHLTGCQHPTTAVGVQDATQPTTDETDARDELRAMALKLATGCGLVEPKQFTAALDAYRAAILHGAADEIAGVDFHPNAKAQCLELARGFARRLRTRAAGAES